jgi:peptidoglycan/LPS O-acetylase OafA/YrhL
MRIVALDIIRFFAALSVVLYHYISRFDSNVYPLMSEVTKFGYLGVPLFFMISGYVIALSANNRTAFQFAASRFVRLYPALWASVIFTVLIMLFLTDKKYSMGQILANFTLLNEYLGYEDIDSVYWTLKAELKFYACISLLLLIGAFNKHHIWLSLWLGITVMHAASGQPFFMGWFITPAYSSFFIAGVAFYLIQNIGKNVYNYFILLSSLVVSSFMAYDQAEGFLNHPNVMEKFISVAIVWLIYFVLYFLCTGKINLKERNIYVVLGALTYPLYLIHNTAGKAIIDQYSTFIPEKVMIVVVIVFMIFSAWIIHLVIEKPLATPLKNYLLSIFESPKPLTSQSSRPPSSEAD